MHPKLNRQNVRRAQNSRRGAFTVEFALCSSILISIMLASIEFNRFMYARHSVDQAAYEAARVGIVPGRTPNDVRATANRILNATGIRNATVTVSPAAFTDSTDTVTVSIRCNYAESSWLRPFYLSSTEIVADMTLDHENKAYLIDVQGDIGQNDNAPIDR